VMTISHRPIDIRSVDLEEEEIELIDEEEEMEDFTGIGWDEQ